MLVTKVDAFKTFVRKNPGLIKYVRTGEMDWQKFYELYDLYGEEESAWNPYLKKETPVVTNHTSADAKNITEGLLGMASLLKGIDLNTVQNGVSSLQRVVGLLQELGNKKYNILKYYLEHHGKMNENLLRDNIENEWQNAIYNGIDTLDKRYRENDLSRDQAIYLSSLIMNELHNKYDFDPSNQRSKVVKEKYMKLMKDAGADMEQVGILQLPNAYDPTFDYDTILSLVA